MIARNIAKDLGAELRLVSVGPLLNEGEEPILGRVVGKSSTRSRSCYILDVGTRLRTKITYEVKSSEGSSLCIGLLEAVSRNVARFGLEVSSVEFRFVSYNSLNRLYDSVNEAERYLVKLRFYPTIFVFRGWRILYPSPSRLIYSLARVASELFGLNSVNMKKLARRLARYVELLNNRTKIVELEIGSNRFVKAFWGEALYGVYGYENMKVLKQLLSIGELVNVGKSRGIGFGHIKLLDVKVVG